MSDAHALMMLMGILFGWPAGTILAYGILLIMDRKSDRKNERELAKQRDEREKARKEQGGRETQEWIKRQQRRNQERIEIEQRRIEQECQHWRQWREFVEGETLIAPRSLEPDFGDRNFGAEILWTYLGIGELEKCKARGEAWTKDNLLIGLKDIPANQAGYITSQALYILRTIRNRLSALPMAA